MECIIQRRRYKVFNFNTNNLSSSAWAALKGQIKKLGELQLSVTAV